MDRRRFLVGVAGLAATLTSCDGNAATALRLRSLKNSIPQQLLGEFHRQFKTAIDLKPDEQLSTLFSHLQTWKQQPKPSEPVPDLVTLGDYWLSTAIRQGLIQPIEAKALPQWNQLPDLWQAIATRNDQGLIDPKGKIWGAPYRWGGTVIVYRADIFRDRRLQPPTDWADLWRPELKRRISLLDQPRETIGLTLKKLGKSYNLQDLRSVPNLEAELEQLHQQAKFYSSDHYLQPLLLGDTWVAVGWSNEVFQTQRRNNELAAVFPRSGTALWADLWVRPAVAAGDRQTLLTDWVNFLWQPETAQQLSRLSYGASPMLQALKDAPDIQAFLPDPEARRRSEFLQPLAEASATLYRQLWERVRRR